MLSKALNHLDEIFSYSSHLEDQRPHKMEYPWEFLREVSHQSSNLYLLILSVSPSFSKDLRKTSQQEV
jgi:hypothetical protein